MVKNGVQLLDVEIVSDRLRIIPTSFAIIEDCFKEFDDEITTFMTPAPAKTIADTERFIRTSRRNMENGAELVCAVLHKTTNEFLGHVGIHEIYTATPELGVWIKKSAHGNHYGKEAVEAVKKWADKFVDYEYLRYPVAKRNIASRKIPESLGGIVVREFLGKNARGEDMEEVEYRIKKYVSS